jgi:hypothetical protein
VINFFNNTGEFVTGGGWITDPDTAGHGTFGFNARYNKNNQPQGQFVYVWRGTYNGVAADFIIKSNSLSALGFSQSNSTSGYPMSARLQGKASVQINQASNGATLAGEGNDAFVGTAADSGLLASNSGDSLSLTLTSSLAHKSFGTTSLSGGNIVIHVK